MSVNIVVDINANEISGRVTAAVDRSIPALTQQMLKDSNFYCPMDQGTLRNSALIASDSDGGKITWNTPYARYLYYGVLMVGENGSAWAKPGEKKHIAVPEKALTYDCASNPNAQALWFEKAKDIHMREWKTFLGDQIRRGL